MMPAISSLEVLILLAWLYSSLHAPTCKQTPSTLHYILTGSDLLWIDHRGLWTQVIPAHFLSRPSLPHRQKYKWIMYSCKGCFIKITYGTTVTNTINTIWWKHIKKALHDLCHGQKILCSASTVVAQMLAIYITASVGYILTETICQQDLLLM